MPMTKFLKKTELVEIDKFNRPENLRQTHVPFSGAPQKHPMDPEKIILLTDPYKGVSSFYEFLLGDISFAEELANIVNIEGETVKTYRLWIKKQSIGIHCSPFMVEDTGR